MENKLDEFKMRDLLREKRKEIKDLDDLRKYKGYSFDFENIAKELYRVAKNGGIVVWIVGDITQIVWKGGYRNGKSCL